MHQFGGGGAEGAKTKNLPLSKLTDRTSKVVHHIKKSTPLSQLKGDMGISPLFGFKISAVPPPRLPQIGLGY